MFVSRRTILQAGALLPALAALPAALCAQTEGGFTHCVASGDPQTSSVRLWTRFANGPGSSVLRVEISETESFVAPLQKSTLTAGPATDYCAHIQVNGLEPGRYYYYRFIGPGGEISPVGRTRTLPRDGIEYCRIAVVSCANATSGWFNAYAHAAARDDLDLVVHLGDYIYESPVDRSDALAELAIARGIAPYHETVSLMDYRLRYASYRQDPALQELHRRHPTIVIWDDHETANNSWQHGASNHGPREGLWHVRKNSALQAFYEWLPMGHQPYARYSIGGLATLFRLETRLLARSQQLDLETSLAGRKDLGPAVAEFIQGPLADPGRTMMGAAQERWLAEGLADSTSSGVAWQVLLQQVIMAPTTLPAIDRSWFLPKETLGEDRKLELALVNRVTAMGVPFGLDRWDGYPAARARLLTAAQRAGSDLVVLSGDSHNAWAYDLVHDDRPAGVEFAVQSVSSLGLEKRFSGNPAHIAERFLAENPNLAWCDTSRRGYVDIELTKQVARCNWHFLPSRTKRSNEILDTRSVSVGRGFNRLNRS